MKKVVMYSIWKAKPDLTVWFDDETSQDISITECVELIGIQPFELVMEEVFGDDTLYTFKVLPPVPTSYIIENADNADSRDCSITYLDGTIKYLSYYDLLIEVGRNSPYKSELIESASTETRMEYNIVGIV